VDTEREDTGWEDGGGDFVLCEIFCGEEEEVKGRPKERGAANSGHGMPCPYGAKP
jgi:hypothetical protein